MTRLFLAAGVAALAIATPAAAKPGGGHGGDDRENAQVQRGGKGGGQAAQARGNGGGRGFKAQDFERRGGGNAVRAERRGGGQRLAAFERGRDRGEKSAARVEQGRGKAANVSARHEQRVKAQRFDRSQVRTVERQQIRSNRIERFENRGDRRREFGDDRLVQVRDFDRRFPNRVAVVGGRGLIEGCPPGLWKRDNDCLPPGHAKRVLGQPISAAARIAALSGLPLGLRGFYPDTDDHYYRYGDGYLYRVDRSSNLINSVLPLIAGGYMPGQVFPTSYMNSYVPDYWGYSGFYQDSPYVDYRYLNGNIYGLDPYSGLIDNVIPMYGYGYGVGQVLPAGYGYYNVPYQYRDIYSNTSDYNYWYSPGAIYQVDPTSQLITAVASLLAPGLSIGQQLPMGYNYYNVPMSYRSTYYDTPDAWYRYNNGYIYQVDPKTQLVTAIVASLLT